MVYFGKVKDGKIIPEPGARLQEGATVRIEPVEEPAAADPVYRLGDFAVDDGGPPDVAAEHDHYIYGTPKRGQPGG
jgi:hypothetical protein